MNTAAPFDPRAEYYLHTNGNIIYKPAGGVDRSSDFVVRAWYLNDIACTPRAFLDWLKECYRLGGDVSRIHYLAKQTQLDMFEPEWAKEVFGERGSLVNEKV